MTISRFPESFSFDVLGIFRGLSNSLSSSAIILLHVNHTKAWLQGHRKKKTLLPVFSGTRKRKVGTSYMAPSIVPRCTPLQLQGLLYPCLWITTIKASYTLEHQPTVWFTWHAFIAVLHKFTDAGLLTHRSAIMSDPPSQRIPWENCRAAPSQQFPHVLCGAGA